MSCAGNNYVVPGADPCIPPTPTTPTTVNTIDGEILLNSPDGSIVVTNNIPTKTISLRPFFDVLTGSFLNPTYSFSGPPNNDLTMTATSTTTYTGTWMFFYQASVGNTGWSPFSNCYTRWTAGPVGSTNVRQVDMGVILTILEHSCAFIDDFGTTPRAVRVSCVLNNISFTTNPTFGGFFYACKLSQ